MADNEIVIINTHEPEGEVAGRMLEIAADKGYSPSVVVAQRGEHDAGLSFRVPQDVAETFNAERAQRWPAPEQATAETSKTTQETTPDEPKKTAAGKAPKE